MFHTPLSALAIGFFLSIWTRKISACQHRYDKDMVKLNIHYTKKNIILDIQSLNLN